MSATTDKPVTWGVLGTAKIALDKVIPGMQGQAGVTVAAIASRDPSKAADAAARLGVARSYGSYEDLLADPDIECVYNPLPNPFHVPWSVRAMEAGKHVLCEKPIALTAEEARILVEAQQRTGRLVAEAFMIRQHPQWLRAREIVRSGEIGTARAVNVLFAYNNVDPANIRNRVEMGGGGLYDIGCYAVTGSRFVFEADPERAVALLDRDPAMGTDRLTSGLMAFPDGRQLAFIVGTQLALHQRVQILGTKGRIEIEVPFNILPSRPTRIFVDDARDVFGGGMRVEEFPASDQYGLQAEAFSRAARGLEPLAFPIDDAIVNMRALDALFRSAETGAWERV